MRILIEDSTRSVEIEDSIINPYIGSMINDLVIPALLAYGFHLDTIVSGFEEVIEQHQTGGNEDDNE